MKQFFRCDVSRADSLSVAIEKKLVEHVPIRVQPVSPGVGLKNFCLFVERIGWAKPPPGLEWHGAIAAPNAWTPRRDEITRPATPDISPLGFFEAPRRA